MSPPDYRRASSQIISQELGLPHSFYDHRPVSYELQSDAGIDGGRHEMSGERVKGSNAVEIGSGELAGASVGMKS